MVNLLDGIKPVLLMGPGPSAVPDAVYAALGKPTLGHLDPYFITIMDGVKERLQTAFKTKNHMTLALSGTGSSGMETCFVNLVEPGDKVLVITNGVFSKRMEEVATRVGGDVDLLEFKWGTPIDVDAVAGKLRSNKYAIVAMVHAETSTGMLNPAEAVGKLVKDSGALFVLDCITSLGCVPVEVDAWGCDAVYSCSQKGLSTPPGLAPVTFSPKAEAKLNGRRHKVPNWYLDMSLLIKYWEGSPRVYHHTMCSNMIYALYAGLGLLLEEGLENSFARHRAMQERLGKGLEKFGISFFLEPQYRLPQINAVTIPAGVDDGGVRGRLLKEFQIEIGSGLGDLAGKIWRIGLLGHTARPENVDRLLAALEKCLK